MHVFVVEFDNAGVIGIYSSKKKAEEYVKNQVKSYIESFQHFEKSYLREIANDYKENYEIHKVEVE